MKYVFQMLFIFSFLVFFGGGAYAFDKSFGFLEQVCKREKVLVCDDYRDTQVMIDENIEKFAQVFESISPYEQKELIKKIRLLTKRMRIREKVEKKDTILFKLQYTRFLLKQILVVYQELQAGIFLSKDTIAKRGTGTIAHQKIRQEVIRQLIEHGFNHFVKRPYVGRNAYITTQKENRQEYIVREPVLVRDDLDRKIASYLKKNEGDFWFPMNQWKKRRSLYLFKNTDDLRALGYRVVSHRTRTSKDAEYRRYNIAKAFELVGHVKVINPGESFSYLEDSQFDPENESMYKQGKVISAGEEVDEYGGGLCGGSTAIYQGSFLNTALAIQSRNHSKRYSSLYRATINGEYQTIPGLDSTIYSPGLDLKMTNISSYPIVLVVNFDGEYEGEEEVFTLGHLSDRGSYEYVSQKRTTGVLKTKKGNKNVVGGCYTWKINGNEVERCYKEVF